VTLEFLPDDPFDDAAARSHFQREARAASALQDPQFFASVRRHGGFVEILELCGLTAKRKQ
jgi:hypothetical protein